jgi:2-oxoisovalerate dehydrogenase E1 component alpha subunit
MPPDYFQASYFQVGYQGEVMTQAKASPTRRSRKKTDQARAQVDGLPEGITPDDLVDYYRKMVLVRTIDERIWIMNRQGKVPIAASAQGHEAAQLGSLLAAQKDGDCFLFPYYRDLGIKMAVGLSPTQVMKAFMGKAGAPYSGARQFPLQGADLEHNVIQISNVVGAALTQAVGYALACRMLGDQTVVLVYFGDGASSQGETHEAMNFAGVHQLPVVFICENNRYAISVPQSKQMAIQDVANRAEGYGFPGVVADGMDFVHTYEATREAIKHAREQGPVLLELKVERFMPHTTDDDDRRYRPKEEVEEVRQRDPLVTMPAFMIEHGFLTQEQVDQIIAEARQAINEATDAADAAEPPDASTILEHVYAP